MNICEFIKWLRRTHITHNIKKYTCVNDHRDDFDDDDDESVDCRVENIILKTWNYAIKEYNNHEKKNV